MTQSPHFRHVREKGGAPSVRNSERSRFTTSAMLFSWKRRMAAMPAAPAARQAWAFDSVIPPRARTGILFLQAWRSASRPAGVASFFSKTGAKTAKVCAAARRLGLLLLGSDRRLRSAGASGESWRAGVPAPTLLFQIALTSCGEISSLRRWTPSAWTASATSVRELMRRAVAQFSVLSSQLRAITLTASLARDSRSRVGRSFSRSWM